MQSKKKAKIRTKRPVSVKLYRAAALDSPVGWVEDKERRWILFFDREGNAQFYSTREISGAVACAAIESAREYAPTTQTISESK